MNLPLITDDDSRKTINLDGMPKWVLRMRSEGDTLAIKIKKITAFMEAGSVGIPHEQAELLELQLIAMNSYLDVLVQRYKVFLCTTGQISQKLDG